MSRQPNRVAASASSARTASCPCMPLTMSSPASMASTSGAIQASGIKPPGLTTPMTIERAPAENASRGVMRGRPVVTLAPEPNSAIQLARRPVPETERRLGMIHLRRVAKKEKIRLTERQHGRVFGLHKEKNRTRRCSAGPVSIPCLVVIAAPTVLEFPVEFWTWIASNL